MADGTTLNSGTGGDVIATDDILGVKHQRVKVEFGADGSATDVSSANPLPVIAAANSGVDIGDVTVNNAAGSTSVPVQGAAAADAAVAGNPVLLGGRASAAAPTDVSADGDAVSLWTTLKGALHVADGGGTLSVDDGGGALTVDGTVAVSGTVTVDASGTTVPVSNAGLTELAAAINASSQVDVNIAASAATVTVSGTVTANLSATDNAVLDNIDADTSAIQTAVELIDDAIVADDAAFTPATTKVMMAGFEFDDTTPDTVNEGDAGAARMSSRREIYTQIRDAAGNERGLAVDANGAIGVTNAGLTALNGAISGTEVQVDVVAALPAGTNAIGKLAANSGVDIGDVDVTSIAAGTNAIGNVGLIGRTSGGMTPFFSLDIDETEEEIKATAGQVFSIMAWNRTATPLYLKFYNATAANVVVGTTTPHFTIPVPANADSDVAGFVWNNEIGFAFGTAITVACTTGFANNDTGAPGANDCMVIVGYA